MFFVGKPLDKEGVRRIVEQHYDDVLAYCRRHAPSSEDVLDATQETFLRFVKSLPAYHDQGKPLAYLLTIARSVCADAYRKHGRSWEPFDENIPAPDCGETDGMREALRLLLPEQREILELKYDHGLRVYEIARIYGISRFAAGRRIKAALNALKVELNNAGEGESL